jgi:cbb3-type cytochrome oxidase subunit 3
VGFIISMVVFSLIVVWALLRPKASMQAAARSVLSEGMSDEQAHIQEKEHQHGLG